MTDIIQLSAFLSSYTFIVIQKNEAGANRMLSRCYF